jgi:hypothetical protein
LGGALEQLSSSIVHCNLKGPWVPMAGPVTNLLVATTSLVLSARMPERFARSRLLLLLVSIFGFFWEGGYAVLAMIKEDGDLYFVGRDFFGSPDLGWRLSGISLGICLYWAGGAILRRRLIGAYPRDGLACVCWVAATAASVVAGALNENDPVAGARNAFFQIGLVCLPLLFAKHLNLPRIQRQPSHPVRPNLWIMLAACLVYLIFVITLGRGLGTAMHRPM